MNGATGFHIDVRPVSITFTCPHCGREVRVPWQELDVPECWGDDWGYAECPDCEMESCKQKSIAEMKKVPQNLHS